MMAVRTTSAADNELAPGESNVELLLTDVLVAWRGVGSSGRRVNWELILKIFQLQLENNKLNQPVPALSWSEGAPRAEKVVPGIFANTQS